LLPTPPGAATVEIDDLEQAGVIARPLSILEVDGSIRVYIQGTEAEVAAQAERLGGRAIPGLDWPTDPEGTWQWSRRVPPALTGDAITRLPSGWRHLALHGVGEIRAASESPDGADDLRSWAEGLGGNLVVTKGDPTVFDPWGKPPPALDLQRRIV